jgi:peroxiredoxin
VDKGKVFIVPRENKKRKVGDRAPSFQLEDAATGGLVSLEKFLGKPLVIIFLRGTW